MNTLSEPVLTSLIDNDDLKWMFVRLVKRLTAQGRISEAVDLLCDDDIRAWEVLLGVMLREDAA